MSSQQFEVCVPKLVSVQDANSQKARINQMTHKQRNAHICQIFALSKLEII